MTRILAIISHWRRGRYLDRTKTQQERETERRRADLARKLFVMHCASATRGTGRSELRVDWSALS
jgi:hypothetical protein